ncbi:MAG: aliphatic sulfonate ABC transporter substrate-binding protein [Methylocella sp.]
MRRRYFLKSVVGAAAASLLPIANAASAAALTEIRIGYQKSGIFPAVKRRGTLEAAFKAQNIAIKWIEFAFGPPILEGIATGNVDFGYTGDAPPIFAQAAGANLLYVAALPDHAAEGIVVHEDSSIQTIADLKGKKVGLAKASSAHNTTAAALEKAGLSFRDINPVYLPPADAVAAFARGSIDAWTVWDPYLALAQKGKVRVIAYDTDVERPNGFFLAGKSFTQSHPDLVTQLNDAFAQELEWARGHRAELAQAIHEATGVDLDALLQAEQRSSLTIVPLNDAIIANQQTVADRFYKLGLIPNQLTVRDIVWNWTPSLKAG